MPSDLFLALDDLLLRVWDPIGVSQEPLASDEYTAYVPVLVEYIEAGSDPEALAERLRRIASISMGIAPRGNERQVAERAYALYAAAEKDKPARVTSSMTAPTPPDLEPPVDLRWTTSSDRRLDSPPPG